MFAKTTVEHAGGNKTAQSAQRNALEHGLTFGLVLGFDDLPGALLGGLLVGVSEALSGFMVLPSLKSMFSFALLIVVLLVRPQGLLGRRA